MVAQAKPARVNKLFTFCIVAVLLASGLSLCATPSVSTRPLPSDITERERSAAQSVIQLARYRCDNVSHIRKLMIGSGYSVNCNNYAYTYTIKDVGGRLLVQVD